MESIDGVLCDENKEDVKNGSSLTNENYAASSNKMVLVEIESVIIGNRLRKVSKSKVDELAESIAVVGLLQPIVITEGGNLVAGLHRLEACRQIGQMEINAVVIPNRQLQKEIAEIDENLIRNQLTVLEQCEQLKRRKELYEALYPETRRGGYARPGSGELEAENINDNCVVNGAFSNRAAQERKVTPRTIQRGIRIAERLDADVKSRISDSPIALRFTQLMRLAEFETAMQREFVEKMENEKLSFPQAVNACKQKETPADVAGRIVKKSQDIKKWVYSLSSLLEQFESFTLTELQAVIGMIKREGLDFSALRRLSPECGEGCNISKSEQREKVTSTSFEDALPLFQDTEGMGEREL